LPPLEIHKGCLTSIKLLLFYIVIVQIGHFKDPTFLREVTMRQKKLTTRQRARVVEKAIQLTWVSLESHLEFAHKDSLEIDRTQVAEEHEFHKMCVQDYAEIIRLLALLY